jgi:tRNA (guanine26-N2/guanine27-N2)-dimethyltransferase
MASESFKSGYPTEIVREGKVKVLVPKLTAFVKHPSDYAPSKAPVFYNPVMEFNRDIAVIAVQVHQKYLDREIDVCEPLTGCGIRGVRFAIEVKNVKSLVLGDINQSAYRLASNNVQNNGLAQLAVVKNGEANFLLSSHGAPRTRFDVVDIDPFGSPVRHLDSAVRAMRNGGLIALTATDMASLSGVHPRACIRKYGGKPLRTEYCHELAVRLLAGCLATVAAKHDVGINVVFSHRGEHYVRVYATIEYGARKADESIDNMGFVLHCFKCFHREVIRGLFLIENDRKCGECGSTLSIAGPLWIGGISDSQFCKMMVKETGTRKLRFAKRIQKMLRLIENESFGPATYFVIDDICDSLNLPVPSTIEVIESLRSEGFQVTPTHFSTRGIRTNALASNVANVIQNLTLEK